MWEGFKVVIDDKVVSVREQHTTNGCGGLVVVYSITIDGNVMLFGFIESELKSKIIGAQVYNMNMWTTKQMSFTNKPGMSLQKYTKI